MIRRCRKKVRESIDQQIKDAMAKKVVGQTTETYKARVLELYYRPQRTARGVAPAGAGKRGGEPHPSY
jgi:hypothetical protein